MVVAAQCVPVVSSWVRQFILTCNNELAVQFRNGVCCLYPKTTKAHFQIAIAAPSPGKFVHQYLFKKLAYQLIKPPCPAAPCGVTTACCPGDPVPTTVHATITGGGALDGVYAMVYDAGLSRWVSTTDLGSCAAGTFYLECATGPTWRIKCGAVFSTVTTVVCNPLSLTFGTVNLFLCAGASGGTIVVTV